MLIWVEEQPEDGTLPGNEPQMVVESPNLPSLPQEAERLPALQKHTKTVAAEMYYQLPQDIHELC